MTKQSEDTQSARKIRVGISSCLLGLEVRFDKGHKRDSYINGTLSDYFDFVPVCPEMATARGRSGSPTKRIGSRGAPRPMAISGQTGTNSK